MEKRDAKPQFPSFPAIPNSHDKNILPRFIEKINEQLVIKDESLQKQILQYVEITNDLLKINDSLGLEDASLLEQLEAIKLKNENLAELNINLIEK